MKVLFFALITLFFNACTTTSADVNYRANNLYSGDSAGNNRFEEIGPIDHSSTSWMWLSCDAAAKKALAGLNERVKSKGGDAVIEVKFEGADGKWVKEASCRSNFVMGMTTVKVKGTAVKLAH